jgi:two-component system, LytTR family, response regulator
MKCIIIEDDSVSLKIIERFLERVPFLHLAEVFNNAIDPLIYLKENEVDLIFLDIRMDRLDGLHFLEMLQNPPQVIITTAFEEYAINSYDLGAEDFLLKPISFERFLKSVNKVYSRWSQDSKNKNKLHSKGNSLNGYNLFVKVNSKFTKINYWEILYFEGMGDSIKIVTENQSFITSQNFRILEKQLPPYFFLRVHKSYIVSLNKIDSIEKNYVKIKDKLIPVSDTYKKKFISRFKEGRILLK